MKDERWRRVEELYHSALRIPADQRAAYMEGSCGEDTALRKEVESLLARRTAAEDFMEAPAFEVAAREIAREPLAARDRHSFGVAAARARVLEEEYVPGSLLADRYRIVTLLGRGGMGAVYRADDLTLGQVVALKFLPRAYAQDKRRMERFRAEVRHTRQISHPSVCRVYDIQETDGLHFLAMEYIDGEDLSSLLRRIGRLPHDKALQIARQICAGLAAAHDRGVLHRDLKPANIMIDGQGHARITDFGLAVNFDDARELRDIAGTPAYMAPEQLAGKPATVKSDLYSLGLVLYELYTGKQAFDVASVEEWKETVSQLQAVPLSARVQDIDWNVERAILQCLEQEPNRRPSSALKVAAALPGGDPLAEAIAAGETPSPEMVAAVEQPALSTGIAWMTLAGVFVLLGSLLVISYRSTFQGLSPVGKEREVLIEQAQKIIRQAGYSAPFADSACDYGYNRGLMAYWVAKEPHNLVQALQKFPGPRFFWYRENARPFRPAAPVGVVDFGQPPLQEGSVRVWLTARGELWHFQAIPRQQEREIGTQGKQVDWSWLFMESGLPFSAFHQTAVDSPPPVPFDTQIAWEGTVEGVPWQVQAASLGGRVVFFAIHEPWTSTGIGAGISSNLGDLYSEIFSGAVLFATLLILGFGGTVAYRNVRRGRGDRKGARWIFLGILILGTLESVGLQHFPENLTDGLNITMIEGIGGNLFLAALAWVGYLAIEPFVRRHWPRLLISWSRIVAGDYRNPIVGRDILMGLMAGCGAAFIVHILHAFPPLAAPLHNGYPAFLTANALVALGTFSSTARGALNTALGATFFLVALRRLFHSEWVAIICTALLLALMAPIFEIGVWWLVYLTSYLAMLICAVVAARLGLVTFAAALVAERTFVLLFSAFRWSDWNAARPLLLLGVFGALAIYGFRIAMARPVLTTALDE